jgi:hypothetical protein
MTTEPRCPTDPLLAALIAKLPASGAHWPVERRAAWLKMVWMAFDVVYAGGAGDAEAEMPNFLAAGVAFNTSMRTTGFAAVEPTAATAIAVAAADPRLNIYYIDRDGHARRGDGKPVMPAEVTDVIHDKRGEHADLAAITWADGSRGVPRGRSLEIAAA